jgi:hypothetical protein
MSPLFTKIWKSCCNKDMSQVIFGIAMSLACKQGGMEGGGSWPRRGCRACISSFRRSGNGFLCSCTSMPQATIFQASTFSLVRISNVIILRNVKIILPWLCNSRRG